MQTTSYTEQDMYCNCRVLFFCDNTRVPHWVDPCSWRSTLCLRSQTEPRIRLQFGGALFVSRVPWSPVVGSESGLVAKTLQKPCRSSMECLFNRLSQLMVQVQEDQGLRRDVLLVGLIDAFALVVISTLAYLYYRWWSRHPLYGQNKGQRVYPIIGSLIPYLRNRHRLLDFNYDTLKGLPGGPPERFLQAEAVSSSLRIRPMWSTY